jgi:hypothetical protein
VLKRVVGRTVLLLAILFVFMTGISQAGESWVTDPKTGTQIGWVHDLFTLTAASWSGPAVDGKAEGKGTLVVTLRGMDNKDYKGQLQAEMVGGKLHGKVSGKFADGDTLDFTYVNGMAEGKGVYTYAERGRIYEGELRNSKPDGFGVYKDLNGKVIYEGQWIEGNPATRPPLDKVLGVAWGASEAEVKKVLEARPKTTLRNTVKYGPITEQQYWGPFGGQEQWILVRFAEGKLYAFMMVQQFTDDKIDLMMERFETARRGLSERYGFADIEKGKYLDAKMAWVWYGKYAVILAPERLATTTPPSFVLRLYYFDAPVLYRVEAQPAASGKSDY